MSNDPGFANLIYEYFVVRFHFQYYKCGDSLPTIEDLCRQFSVSSLTIKSAFKHLQDEGYISRSHGRCARVLFSQSDEEVDAFAIRFFSQRRTVIPDFYRSTELIVMPMLARGFTHMDDEDFAYLNQLAEQTDPEDQIRFYCYILRKTQNPLIMNLFWESALYLGLPFPVRDRGHTLYNKQLSRRRLTELATSGRDGTPEQIYAAHLAFQRDVSKEIHSYIVNRIPPGNQTEQLPFTWRVYRDRPQICCDLAVQVIHDVYMGEYCGREFLPSYEKMAQKYHASVSTIRRTIRLLNQLGATQTLNGKGTRILLLNDSDSDFTPDLTLPAIRTNMAYYIQSFELLAESCEGVMCTVLKAISDEEKHELTSMLEECIINGRYYISPQCIFSFIAEHSPLKSIQEIYGKLYSLNLWGYPMKKYRKEMPDLGPTMREFTETVIHFLQENNTDSFSKTVSRFMKNEYKIAKKILEDHGYEPEDMSFMPSFSLIHTKEP